MFHRVCFVKGGEGLGGTTWILESVRGVAFVPGSGSPVLPQLDSPWPENTQ